MIFCLSFFRGWSQEVCNNCIDDNGDGLIDCYDPLCIGSINCDDFYIGNLSSRSDTTNRYNLIELWSIEGIGYSAIPLVGDMDGDNIPEFFISNYGSIDVYNGKTGSKKNTISQTGSIVTGKAAIADVDNDGSLDIFVGASPGNFTMYSGGNMQWKSTSNLGNEYDPYPMIVNFNGDDTAEILILGAIYNSITGQLIINMDTLIEIPSVYPGKYLSHYAVAADVIPTAACEYCDGLELIYGSKVYSISIEQKEYTLVAEASFDVIGPTAIADIDYDGALDVVVNSEKIVYAWNPRTLNLIGNPYIKDTISLGLPSIGNVDDDPELEIALVEREYFLLIDDDMTLKWKTYAPDITSYYVGSTMFDLDCDEKQEVIYRGDDGYLYIFNGDDGVILAATPCGSGTRGERPIVVDINADGYADILCGCQEGSQSMLKAWSGEPNGWASARKVMNQYAFINTYINDDLTVPCVPQSPANKKLPMDVRSFSGQAHLYDKSGKACNIENTISKIFLPNVIYTNSNEGNDKFKIVAEGIESINLSIYSKKGVLVFQTQDQNVVWDGRKDEKELPQGVYTYYLQYKSILNEQQGSLKGNITLIR